MSKAKRFLVFILILAAVGGGLWVYRSYLPLKFGTIGTAKEKAVYYCPMHPTYTSDRPGDCPICNMKLVKREPVSVPGTAGTGSANLSRNVPGTEDTAKKDICYLHNCPHLKDGKPCPMLVVAKEGEAVTCPICGTHIVEKKSPSKSKKILYWTDPMLPGYKSDKPGKSPMGMEMVPVYEEETPHMAAAGAPEGYAPILISSQKQQLIGVKTASAQKRAVTKTIRTVGRIAYDPELYQAQEEYIQAIQALRKAETGTILEVKEQAAKLVDSSKIKLKLLGLSNELINEIESAGKPDRSLLYSEAGGKVWLY
ncbi:MAG: efflux RND transporter periplasmic adaptor subunit, partial [Candidatus Omnitrophica bacterium]|nr:efflux RND transporter periplasmic adaptor subunit [Candidatus Omnitrophota bacterium]